MKEWAVTFKRYAEHEPMIVQAEKCHLPGIGCNFVRFSRKGVSDYLAIAGSEVLFVKRVA
jgi:hypothetical protein